ncbi:hypothetical protein BDR05DRAFT_953280 [Suillus weaverae]|nr:hypothetical protein BDR05DRAFT_953280 [Suillus weaverae]
MDSNYIFSGGQDKMISECIQPSLIGYISKGIAHCRAGYIWDARVAFDIPFMYTNQELEPIRFLLLIKAITLFNADQYDEAYLLLKELTTGCLNTNTCACHIMETYLHVQLGIKALNGICHNKAADYFTVALNSSNPSLNKQCQAFLSTGKVDETLKSHKYIIDSIDKTTKQGKVGKMQLWAEALFSLENQSHVHGSDCSGPACCSLDRMATTIAKDTGRQLVATGHHLTQQQIKSAVNAVTMDKMKCITQEYLWDY